MSKADRPKLQANKRTVVGKKVKTLRRQGILPANLYGPDRESLSIEVNLKKFTALYNEAGSSTVCDVVIDKEVIPVLIQSVKVEPVTDRPVHAELYALNMTRGVDVSIPVHFVGESPAVKDGVGVFIVLTDEIEVKALPDAIPDHFEADISKLVLINDAVTVSDLDIPDGVTLLIDPESMICKINEIQEEEVEVAPIQEIGETGEATVAGDPGEASDDKSVEDDKSE